MTVQPERRPDNPLGAWINSGSRMNGRALCHSEILRYSNFGEGSGNFDKLVCVKHRDVCVCETDRRMSGMVCF